jgi:hypothetical protein
LGQNPNGTTGLEWAGKEIKTEKKMKKGNIFIEDLIPVFIIFAHPMKAQK